MEKNIISHARYSFYRELGYIENESEIRDAVYEVMENSIEGIILFTELCICLQYIYNQKKRSKAQKALYLELFEDCKNKFELVYCNNQKAKAYFQKHIK